MSATTPPAVVFRSSYVRVRRMLMFMLAVSVALAIALVLVATNDSTSNSSPVSSVNDAHPLGVPAPPPAARATACGYRFDSPGFVAVPCTNTAPLPH